MQHLLSSSKSQVDAKLVEMQQKYGQEKLEKMDSKDFYSLYKSFQSNRVL